MGVFNLISALALFLKTLTQTENYDHANKDHKYIVFMACNANIASTETNLHW